MTIVTEYDWESDAWTHHTAENAARATWREAIEIAEKAKATLRQSATAASTELQLVRCYSPPFFFIMPSSILRCSGVSLSMALLSVCCCSGDIGIMPGIIPSMPVCFL
jgi:hypothetical protein